MRFWTVTVFIAGALVAFSLVRAYSQLSTHPELTDEIVDFWNARAPEDQRISNGSKQRARHGSIDEDTPPRWVNHFYDPQSCEGWTGENWGPQDRNAIQALSATLITPGYTPLASPSWAQNSLAQ